jgi:hypothetical protein
MPNTPERAKFWKEFILSSCQYPAPAILRAQFEHATFSEFCDCGCNSFKISVPKSDAIPRLASEGGYGAVFEADFRIEDGKTLEIILFAGEDGNLAYVEVDCCGNSYPVPEDFTAEGKPYHVQASESIAL